MLILFFQRLPGVFFLHFWRPENFGFGDFQVGKLTLKSGFGKSGSWQVGFSGWEAQYFTELPILKITKSEIFRTPIMQEKTPDNR